MNTAMTINVVVMVINEGKHQPVIIASTKALTFSSVLSLSQFNTPFLKATHTVAPKSATTAFTTHDRFRYSISFRHQGTAL